MDGPAPSPTLGSDGALRDELTNLLSMLVLSIRMTESRVERQILELATTSVPSLVDSRIHGVFLEWDGWLLTSEALTAARARAAVEAQFAVLSAAGGPVTLEGDDWGWAFPLRTNASRLGHLVVGARVAPSPLHQFLLRVLAQQVGIALANARLHAQEQATSAALRAANARLADSVAATRHRVEIHERLTQAAMTGTGLAGIVEAVHELTRHPIVVEDRAGNVIARAGLDDAAAPVRQPRGARERMIQHVLDAAGPVREGDRIVVIASPREGVTGVMSLIDPEGTAGESEVVALEHGATVAAMELSRMRSLGETRLRLGRALLEDLLAGTDPEAAIERAKAIGCDLLQPRRVAVIERVQSGVPDEDQLVATVRRALHDQADAPVVTTRGGAVVVLARAETDWQELGAAMERNLGSACRVGVGGVGSGPADVARSHREAWLALKVADGADGATGVRVFDHLGVFRLLAEVEDAASIERFVRSWLGPLLDYDAGKPAELVPTLSRFLEVGQAHGAASEALSIHPSTLKYRLKRIREISRQDLSDPDTRFNLQLATRAWQALAALRDVQQQAARSL